MLHSATRILIITAIILLTQVSLAKHISILQSKVKNLDPIHAADTNTQLILNNAYDGLVEWDYEKGVKPQIADTWQTLDAGTAYRFIINKNAIFNDGSRITSESVKSHFDRLLKNNSYYMSHYQNIKKVTADGESVVFNLNKADKNFLYLLGGVAAKIVKIESKFVIGSGPYNIKINEKGVELTINSSYWKEKPSTDIIFYVMDEDEAISAAKKGSIDDMSIIANQGDEVNTPETSWISQSMWATWIIGFDQRVPPFNIEKLRCAIKHSISSEKFVKELFPKQLLARNFVPFGMPGYSNEKLNIDIDKEFKYGKEITIHIPSFLSKAKAMKRFLDKEMKAAGLNPNIVLSDFNWMIENYAQGKYGSYLLSLNAEYPDTSFYYNSLLSSSKSNYFGIRDPKLDDLIIKSNKETRPQVLSENNKQINIYLSSKCASVNLFHVKHYIWKKKCVDGIKTNPISEGYFNYRNISNKCHEVR